RCDRRQARRARDDEGDARASRGRVSGRRSSLVPHPRDPRRGPRVRPPGASGGGTMTREIVEAYLRAFYAGDAEEARRHLADDVSVTGPASRFEDADGFLKAAAHVAAGVSAVRMKKVVVDGADACAFYELEVNHRVGRMAVAERYRLADDKIATIQTIFDMAPFVPSAGKDV